MDYTIREIKAAEVHLLEEFTYQAVFQRDSAEHIGREVLLEPEIKIFYEDFGRSGDICFVAEIDGTVVGAVWTRILAGEIKGFGNIDEYTPEFAISLFKEHRGRGIGTALMRRMLNELAVQGHDRASLAVQKDNYAVVMYLAVGFVIVKEMDEEYLMVCQLRE